MLELDCERHALGAASISMPVCMKMTVPVVVYVLLEIHPPADNLGADCATGASCASSAACGSTSLYSQASQLKKQVLI